MEIKWRKNKEREQKLRKAIDKKVSPEIRLCIERHNVPDLFHTIIWFLVVSIAIGTVVSISYSLVAVSAINNIAGENFFENIMEHSGQIEHMTNLLSVYPIIAIIFFTLIILELVVFVYFHPKKMRKLEKQILKEE